MASPRRFDHDEARARHAAGEKVADLARAYGVTANAIYFVVSPEARERALAYSRRWRTGSCADCGGPAMRPTPGSSKQIHADGLTLCNRCRRVRKRERLAFDTNGVLVRVRCTSRDCANGDRWQPPEHFARGSRFRDVRDGGIHNLCRACLTRARQSYRERHKLPCGRCGAPCLPPGEKGNRGLDRLMCANCDREMAGSSRDRDGRFRERAA